MFEHEYILEYFYFRIYFVYFDFRILLLWNTLKDFAEYLYKRLEYQRVFTPPPPSNYKAELFYENNYYQTPD